MSLQTYDQDIQLARTVTDLRAIRGSFLPSVLFGEFGWDMLLGAYADDRVGAPFTRAALVALSGGPRSVALRWFDVLVLTGMIERHDAKEDAYVLTDAARSGIAGVLTGFRDRLTAVLDAECRTPGQRLATTRPVADRSN